MTHNDNRQTVKPSRTANDSRVVRKPAVPMQFNKLIKQPLDIVQGMRPVRMASELNSFDGGSRLSLRGGRPAVIQGLRFLFFFSHLVFCVVSRQQSL